MLLNGLRPIGWSRVTCTFARHSFSSRNWSAYNLHTHASAARDYRRHHRCDKLYIVTVKVYTRVPEHVKVDSDRANERERRVYVSLVYFTSHQGPSRERRSLIFLRDRSSLLAWSGLTFTGVRWIRVEGEEPQIAFTTPRGRSSANSARPFNPYPYKRHELTRELL